jgi:hypothetical protein
LVLRHASLAEPGKLIFHSKYRHISLSLVAISFLLQQHSFGGNCHSDWPLEGHLER